jgi:uncharacterized membrane protein
MRIAWLPDRREFIAVFIVLLVLFETIVVLGGVPYPRDHWFDIYLLDSNRAASNYYPRNNTNIEPGVQVAWYVGVSNSMGSVQLIAIVVKAGNQTTKWPNDQQAIESPAPVLVEFARFLQDNETWEKPFIWSIENGTSSNGYAHILSVRINNVTYPISGWTASNGYNFRLIFELWTWQIQSNSFIFGWVSNEQRRVAWLQIWFNATTTETVITQ